MSLVTWLGKPDNWTPPKPDPDAYWVLAATDDALPEVLQQHNKARISSLAAVRALDRAQLRRAVPAYLNLPHTIFSYEHSKVVVKAAASSASSGVHILNLRTDEMDTLRKVYEVSEMPFSPCGVVEQYVEGKAIEISGVKLSGQIRFFYPLRQRWSEDGTRITAYERCSDYWWLYEFSADLLEILTLDCSAFCIEWRVTGEKQARVIEVNPRLGEDDKDYFKLLWDRQPTEQIEAWAAEIYPSISTTPQGNIIREVAAL